MFLCVGRNANFIGSLIHIPTFHNNTKKAVLQISSHKNSGLSNYHSAIKPASWKFKCTQCLSLGLYLISSMVLPVVTIVLYSVVYHYRITDMVAADLF